MKKKSPTLICLRFSDNTFRFSDRFPDINSGILNSKDCADIFKFYLNSPVFRKIEDVRDWCMNVYGKGISHTMNANEDWKGVVLYTARNANSGYLRGKAKHFERLIT
jgi:hypothetical protein